MSPVSAPLPLLTLVLATTASIVHAADWPHWRGPQRNDHSSESSGWDGRKWLPNQPAWSRQLAEGSSSPITAGNKLYSLGYREGNDELTCLDVTSGQTIWRTTYPAPRYGRLATGDQGLYSGPSSTPEYDPQTGWLYTLGADGDLHAWNVTADKPRRAWHINLYDSYEVDRRPKVGRSGRRDYGYTSSPLVYRDTLIVEVGAATGTLVGFDKRTGQELWRSAANDPAGHNGGPVLINIETVPCVAVHHFAGLLIVRLDEGHAGETLAEYPWKTDFANNIATPSVLGNSILLTSGYNQHRIARFDVTREGITKRWEVDELSKVCSPVIHKGSVYWAWRQMYCLDFTTGKIRWHGGNYGDPGSCIATSDDRLIVWSKQGDLTLVESATRAPSEYVELNRVSRVTPADAWPHVVLSNGRLFCKDRAGKLVCFLLDSRETQSSPREKQENKSAGNSPVSPSPASSTPSPDTPRPALPRPQIVFDWSIARHDERYFEKQGDITATNAGINFGQRGGSLVVRRGDKVLPAALRNTNAFSLEVVLQTASLEQTGPARIVSSSQDAYHRNFTLGQEGAWLLLRLRTSRTDENGMRHETKLCRLTPDKMQHVLVSYEPGQLTCYVNGQLVASNNKASGDFSNWQDYPFIFGNEANGDRAWKGVLKRVTVHRNSHTATTAAQRYQRWNER